jgi:ParB family chromosome partitioning protein
MTPPKKSALGRGLDALISTDLVKTQGSSSINEIPVSQIHANPDQPRRDFDPESLQELAESIREIGIIQPITLRKIAEGDYQIIAGERRFRAAGLAGLKTIPAYIRTADDENVMAMALIENIQREDLNSMEVALACQNLLEVYNMTQEQLSARIGKKRATIANYIRLLKLPAEIQVALKNKQIDMGHARALLAIDDPMKQLQLFHELTKYGYSVRMVEDKARQMNEKKAKTSKSAADDSLAPLGRQLSKFLGAPVKVKSNAKGAGSISISFKNDEDLARLMQMFDRLKK